MKTHKRILKNVAKNYHIDSDELLINLWDYSNKFGYLNNGNDVIKGSDIFLVKKIISSKLSSVEVEPLPKKRPQIISRKNYDFSSIGTKIQPISYITREEALKIHEELTLDFVNENDPIDPPGLKNESLLESALFHPQTSYAGKYKYTTIETAGAALMYSVSSNHAFHNGNKRTAMVSMLVLLDRHHFSLVCNEDELFKKSFELAKHNLVPEGHNADAEIFELARWIHSNSKYVTKGERVITLKKLRRLLLKFNCEILTTGKVIRKLNKKDFFGNPIILKSKRVLDNNISEGDTIDKGLIKSIRDDLRLTHKDGIDSEAFYEEAEFTSSEFILKYRNVLRRLSKV